MAKSDRDDLLAVQRRFARTVTLGTKTLSAVDSPLAAWIASVGKCALPVAWERSLYESLVRAIAHQQLHGRAAETILRRFTDGFRGSFPAPKDVAVASLEKLRGMGFSTAKSLAIQGIATAALNRQIPTRKAAESWTDAELIGHLSQLRGVGQWTVEMLLIFTLGRLDVMPVDDFGVRNGYRLLHGLDAMPKPRDVLAQTEGWRPYRSIAAWYLWRRADAAKNA